MLRQNRSLSAYLTREQFLTYSRNVARPTLLHGRRAWPWFIWPRCVLLITATDPMLDTRNRPNRPPSKNAGQWLRTPAINTSDPRGDGCRILQERRWYEQDWMMWLCIRHPLTAKTYPMPTNRRASASSPVCVQWTAKSQAPGGPPAALDYSDNKCEFVRVWLARFGAGGRDFPQWNRSVCDAANWLRAKCVCVVSGRRREGRVRLVNTHTHTHWQRIAYAYVSQNRLDGTTTQHRLQFACIYSIVRRFARCISCRFHQTIPCCRHVSEVTTS